MFTCINLMVAMPYFIIIFKKQRTSVYFNLVSPLYSFIIAKKGYFFDLCKSKENYKEEILTKKGHIYTARKTVKE